MAPRLMMVLLAGLLGCDRPAAPPTPPPAPKAPSLQVSGTQVDLGGPVKAYRFSLEASGCRTAAAALYHLSGDTVTKVTSHEFKSLPDTLAGDLWLTEQTGEPFGKSGVLSYSLGQTVRSPSTTSVVERFPLIEGAFPHSSQQFHTAGSVMSGQEAVLFARCMSRSPNHSFGTGSLEQIQQHARETKDVVVVVTLRWERN